MSLPHGLINYGPNANCTLELCPVTWSALSYRPSIPASAVFIALFGLSMIIHIGQCIRYRSWGYTACMVLGCICEIIGYYGRIELNHNPFSFNGFLIQIICITVAPVFFCGAIYVTLSRTITYLDRSLSRFNPKILYWAFIPADIVSLGLQAGGGASSSNSTGKSSLGVNVTLAGLSLQVATLVVFIILSLDYFVRFRRSAVRTSVSGRFKIFILFLSLAILLILVRCSYRIAELSEGYGGAIFHNEGLFYGLESALIVISAFCLNVSNPVRGMPAHRGGKNFVSESSDVSLGHSNAAIRQV